MYATVCAHTFHARCVQTLCASGERRDAGDADTFACPCCRTANTYLWAAASDAAASDAAASDAEASDESDESDSECEATVQHGLRMSHRTSEDGAMAYMEYRYRDLPDCECEHHVRWKEHAAPFKLDYRLLCGVTNLMNRVGRIIVNATGGVCIVPFPTVGDGTINAAYEELCRMQSRRRNALSDSERTRMFRRLQEIARTYPPPRNSYAAASVFDIVPNEACGCL